MQLFSGWNCLNDIEILYLKHLCSRFTFKLTLTLFYEMKLTENPYSWQLFLSVIEYYSTADKTFSSHINGIEKWRSHQYSFSKQNITAFYAKLFSDQNKELIVRKIYSGNLYFSSHNTSPSDQRWSCSVRQKHCISGNATADHYCHFNMYARKAMLNRITSMYQK